jgi:hypothetical protein
VAVVKLGASHLLLACLHQSYAIVRVSGFNESPSSEASTIELKSVSDRTARILAIQACAIF